MAQQGMKIEDGKWYRYSVSIRVANNAIDAAAQELVDR